MLSLLKLGQALRPNVINQISVRCFSRGVSLRNEEEAEAPAEDTGVKIHPSKDRRKPVSVDTSIRYLASEAYKETYGNDPVWKPYRRNHKGQIPPRKTRKTCIRDGIISTGNPCPICRDEYLVFDHKNTDLLYQFMSEFNGEIISYQKTGICQRQHRLLKIAVHRAREFGTIPFDVPIREYNYSDWYRPEEKKEEKSS